MAEKQKVKVEYDKEVARLKRVIAKTKDGSDERTKADKALKDFEATVGDKIKDFEAAENLYKKLDGEQKGAAQKAEKEA